MQGIYKWGNVQYKKQGAGAAARQLPAVVVCDYSKLFEYASPSGATKAERGASSAPHPARRGDPPSCRARHDEGCGMRGGGQRRHGPAGLPGAPEAEPRTSPLPPAPRVVATLNTCRACHEGWGEGAAPTAPTQSSRASRAATVPRVPPGRGRCGRGGSNDALRAANMRRPSPCSTAYPSAETAAARNRGDKQTVVIGGPRVTRLEHERAID